ncbi:MAG TPA: histidinol-phosphate transaminase [Bacteroidota bacterium]|nr:histidinol-phosphate transaminase [Bacteroidota bacterium]
MSFIDNIKRSVRALETYTVKGKAPQPGLIKLNQNENPFDVPVDIKRELVDEFLKNPWNRYPEVFPGELLQALSSHAGHPMEGIIAGNGSNELMYTVLMATVTRGTKVLIPSPSFFLYEKAVKVFDGEVIPVMMNGDLSFNAEKILHVAKKEQPAVIVLVSPNSPTGQSVPIDDVEKILAGTASLVLVDEAYIEFSDKGSVQSLINKYDRLIVLRTFSKAFSMAGLRIGYLLAQPPLCAELLKPKIPFTVNAFSASVAIRLMGRKCVIDERIAFIKNQKRILFDALRSLKGVEAFPSDTNFLIFRTPHDAGTLFQQLLQRNILVRDVSSYPMLERTLRVNAGTESENRSFLSVLNELL